MSKRILVVDDDQKLVRLLQSYLEQAGMLVLTAYEGDTALHLIRRERPDLIILDIGLPGRDGWEITRLIRADNTLAAIPILMLTARVEDSDKIHGLELGADDYLTKPFNPLEVVARVRAILRRSYNDLSPVHILQSGELRLDIDHRDVTLSGQPMDMTPTEFAILQTLMRYPNHTFTRDELIEQALGYNYDGLDRTLDSHIKNLRKKIGAHYIETVFGVGYRFREE